MNAGRRVPASPPYASRARPGPPAEAFRRDGYVCLDALLSEAECDASARELAATDVSALGARNLLALPWCQRLARTVRARVPPGLLPHDAAAVQCTVFAKSLARNWVVAWHQDLVIPVRARIRASGWTCWSRKEGRVFVQPPDAVLAGLAAVRVHLDAVGRDQGPLRVLAGTHRQRVAAGSALPGRHPEHVVLGQRGSAVVMRPLLVHASARARAAGPRRVLHILYGPRELPAGARWATAP